MPQSNTDLNPLQVKIPHLYLFYTYILLKKGKFHTKLEVLIISPKVSEFSVPGVFGTVKISPTKLSMLEDSFSRVACSSSETFSTCFHDL